jgi:hypothetical protein
MAIKFKMKKEFGLILNLWFLEGWRSRHPQKA